jgi:hypothetical protein
MSIHVASLSRQAYVAIRELAEEREWCSIHAWMEPAEFLLLIERLIRTEDSIEVFPMGKSATIQSMRQIFERDFSND